MKSKKELFNKLTKLTPKMLKEMRLEKSEIDYIKTKLLNDKIGLTLNFKEIDEPLSKNYMVLEDVEELGIDVKVNEKNNLLIEGDNYYALKALETAGQKVDVIYIDPPYNTGKEFIYSDDFSTDPKLVTNEDAHKHSKWLSFMKRRLILAKKLLSDDGVIFVSIDDNEQAYLKVLMDEIFGENNFISSMPVVSAPAGSQSSNAIAQQHSYVILYSESERFKPGTRVLTNKEIIRKYNKNHKGDNVYFERLWKRGVGGKKEDVPSLHFPIYYDEVNDEIFFQPQKNTIEIIPYQTKGVLGRWTWSKKKMIEEIDNLKMLKVAGEWKLHKIMRQQNDKGKKFTSIIPAEIGRTELGSLELKEIMGDKVFEYPKYSSFVEYLISINGNKNIVVLDFFAGSGTTGQAVVQLNRKDGGNRRFILATNNQNQIAEKITRERIYRVINGVGSKGEEIKYSPYHKNDHSMRYLRVKHIDKITGDFEQIDEIKNIFKNEFDNEIDIIDLNGQEE